MVRFVDDDGTVTYYGTCTAFDGYRVLPQLIETRDFLRIGVHTINGACARNKGMALFPRRIGGHYVMCSRIDGENLYIMFSDIVHFWETAELLQTPRYPWGLVQIGNCGSPLETPEGWLLADPRRRPHAHLLHRRHAAGPERPAEGDRLPRRAADRAHRKGTRRLRAQRRLLCGAMIHNGQSLPPLRHVRHDYPLRHRVARFPAEPAHRLRCRQINKCRIVAFRSAKVALHSRLSLRERARCFRGAKGDSCVRADPNRAAPLWRSGVDVTIIIVTL